MVNIMYDKLMCVDILQNIYSYYLNTSKEWYQNK